jgi:hypothetical protein
VLEGSVSGPADLHQDRRWTLQEGEAAIRWSIHVRCAKRKTNGEQKEGDVEIARDRRAAQGHAGSVGM